MVSAASRLPRCTPVICTLGRPRQRDGCEFEGSLSYKGGSGWLRLLARHCLPSLHLPPKKGKQTKHLTAKAETGSSVGAGSGGEALFLGNLWKARGSTSQPLSFQPCETAVVSGFKNCEGSFLGFRNTWFVVFTTSVSPGSL